MTYLVITSLGHETYITNHKTLDEAMKEYKGRISYSDPDTLIVAKTIKVDFVAHEEE